MAKNEKSDMDRVGLFREMGYTTIGDPYKPPNSLKPIRPNAGGDKDRKPMVVDSSKSRNATQAGYFSKTFDRVMEGESYSDPIKRRRQKRIEEAKKNVGKAFVPTSGTKLMSGVGSHFGTLGGPIKAFSPVTADKKPYKSPGKNFVNNPPKKGTGSGYIGVTIGPSQKYASEPYDLTKELKQKEVEVHKKKMKGAAFKLNVHPADCFDANPYKTDKPVPAFKEEKKKKEELKPFKPSSPAKASGGMKAGTFDPYPEHSSDPYVKNPPKRKSDDGGTRPKIFQPPAIPKSTPTKSIVSMTVRKSMNRNNYKAVATTM